MSELKPCPFCGGEAEFERMGTGRQSCIVTCTNCGCRHESGDCGGRCGHSWNTRHTEPIKLPRVSPENLVELATEAWESREYLRRVTTAPLTSQFEQISRTEFIAGFIAGYNAK